MTSIPTSSLAQMRVRGTGPRYFKLGRRVLYRRDDVVAWLAENAKAKR